jgi:short-subunit dehydrogenase
MSNRHAIVVGASSGIGLSIARRLKSAGYTVSSLSRRLPPEDAVNTALCCDVLDDNNLIDAIGELIEKHGVPEAIVYSAGYPVMGATLSVPEAEARQAFEVHFWGLDRVVRTVLPQMRAHGGGTVLALLSIAALCPPPFQSYYSASKAAAIAYLRALSLETKKDNVKIKWLAPGYVNTGFLERGNWFGMPVPSVCGSGVTPEKIAEEVLRMLRGGPDSLVLGWRERCLSLGTRLSPGIIKRWMQSKVSDGLG